jgi:DNA-binding CsgD family transcriptional regulator
VCVSALPEIALYFAQILLRCLPRAGRLAGGPVPARRSQQPPLAAGYGLWPANGSDRARRYSRVAPLPGRCSIPLVVEALPAQPRSAATVSRLTSREREVLGELATGFSNRTVAQRLVLSQRAVEKHINSISPSWD